MAITLGQLRSYCTEEVFKDAQGSTAERAFMHAINSALSRLYREVPLDLTRRVKKLTVVPAETRTDVGVIQGSLAITSGTNFTAKYLSDRWGLHIEGEARHEFEIAAIGVLSATLVAGDEWIQTTDAAAEVFFVYNKLALTEAAEVYGVLTEDNRELPILPDHVFDNYKRTRGQTARGSYPEVCCLRRGRLEIYPSPGDDYYKLEVTYRLAFTPHNDNGVAAGGDADATVVVWDDQHLDILKKALMMEGSMSQGASAPIPYAMAAREFEMALSGLRDNAMKTFVPGPINISTPIMLKRRGRLSLPPRRGVEDQ